MTQDTPILSKTRELCETILAEPTIRSIRRRIDTFMDNEEARSLYEGVVTKGQALQERQERAEPLIDGEIAVFEKEREALLKNTVARDFIDAQEELHDVQHRITKYVRKTLELGRLPSEDDLNGGCGSHSGGCGCGHNH